MKLAWVTGARGFLGRHVARHLNGEGWRVIGIGYGEWTGDEAKTWGIAEWRRADVDLPALRELAAVAGPPDVIFHAAGSASVGFSLEYPFADFQRTVTTTAAVLEVMRTAAPAALLIYPSSAAVYGIAREGPIPESSPIAPVSPYGLHKAMAEELCMTHSKHFGLRCAIVRFFSVYGPGLRKQLLWDLAQKIEASPAAIELHGTGDETRDFLHGDDAARIGSLVARSAGNEPLIINGGSGDVVSVRDIANLVAIELGEKRELHFSGKGRAGDPPHYRADTRRLARLGFVPRWTLQAGVRDYVAWLRKADSGSQRTIRTAPNRHDSGR
jgi:UDP-glucose 4-epimerase